MIVEIHYILLVANGICIIIHNVIWYNNTYSNIFMNKYTYMHSNTNNYTCMNTFMK